MSLEPKIDDKMLERAICYLSDILDKEYMLLLDNKVEKLAQIQNDKKNALQYLRVQDAILTKLASENKLFKTIPKARCQELKVMTQNLEAKMLKVADFLQSKIYINNKFMEAMKLVMTQKVQKNNGYEGRGLHVHTRNKENAYIVVSSSV